MQAGNGNSLPSFKDYEDGEGQIRRYHQAIIPSYRFQCCGNVTEWRVDVHPGGGKDNREYTLNLQVWRPSPRLDLSILGHYNLIGNNRFTSISLSDGAALVTPLPRDYIQFRPGDVLGFHVEEARDDNRGVVVLTTDSYTRDTVWHAGIPTSHILGCPVSVGNGGTLNTVLYGAPVIEIDTGTLLIVENFNSYMSEFSEHYNL